MSELYSSQAVKDVLKERERQIQTVKCFYMAKV